MRKACLIILTILFLSCGGDNLIPSIPNNFKNSALQTYGGTESESGDSITATSDGGYAIVGTFRSNDDDFNGFNRGDRDIFVMKFDSEGKREWMKTFGGSGSDFVYSLVQTFDDGLIITGSTNSNDGDFNGLNKGSHDIYILKLDKNGEKQWLETFGGSSADQGSSIIQTSDGGYAITGHFKSDDGDFYGLPSYDEWNVFILKIRGEQQWLTTFGGDNIDLGNSITETSDGFYTITGSTFSQDGDFNQPTASYFDILPDIFVLKIDTDGNHVWTRRFGGSHGDTAFELVSTYDGVIVTGESYSNDGDFIGLNIGVEDIFALKVDLDGNLQWVKTYGGSNYEIGSSIIRTDDSGYILTGLTISNDGDFNEMMNGIADVFVLKIDFSGDIQWVDTFGGSLSEYGSSIAQTIDGNYVITGGFNSYDGFFEGHNLNRNIALYEDIFIIELDNE